MEQYHSDGSRRLFEELSNYLVDGVASSFHKADVEAYPICASHGKGSKVYDVDGNEYIDYVLGFGPLLLGHAPECVAKAVSEQLLRGSQFSMPTHDLLRLTRKLTEIIPLRGEDHLPEHRN